MAANRVVIIGMGDDGPESLSTAARRHIEGASILYGGERQLTFFEDFKGERHVIESPLQGVIEDIEQHLSTNKICVLASGDPLFYGIGSTLVKRLGQSRVTIVPNLSSAQLACARAGESWQDANLISLHGRPISGFAQRIHQSRLAVVLTDGVNTPSAIAKYLMHYEMYEYDVFVAEHLGGEDERAAWYSLEEAAKTDYAPLNVVLLKSRSEVEVSEYALGMDDSRFSQRKPDRGLITKREVRVLSLAELSLKPGDVLWDIGACTGSISIEAILSLPNIQVFAVEKNAADLENLRENQIRFRTDFTAVCARAPEGLTEFPDPDAVFVGGSGGELEELLNICAARLSQSGRVVVNAATIENLYQAQQTLSKLGFSVSVTLVQTARSKPILNLTRFEGMNPVYLVTGRREQTKEESASDN